MSYQLMAWAAEQKTGSPTRKAVLLALANAANHHSGRCHPSVARIADETECSEKTVKRALADLDKSGYISRSRSRRKDGTFGIYQYGFPHVVPAADLETPASQPGTPNVSGPRDTVTPSPGDTVTPLNQEVVLNREEDLAATPHERPRNELWDTLSYVFGEPETASAKTLRGKTVRSLKAAGATPTDVLGRAKRWPLHFDTATLTETALEKHWHTLERPPLRRRTA